MQTIALPDALDAMQRNIKLFLDIATGKAGTVEVMADAQFGTAFIRHNRDIASGLINATVYFPVAPAQHRLTKVELNRWIAYFIHELCHAVYTDETSWSLAVAESLQALVNGMEDVRIEREFNRAGTAGNSADLLTELMVWATAKCPPSYDPNDMLQLPWTLAMFGRVRLCGYAIADVARYDAMLSPSTRRLVDWTMAQLDRAQSTADVLEIARKIQRRLAAGSAPAKRDGPEGNPRGGKADGDASKADGEAKADGDASKADGEPSKGAAQGDGDGKAGMGDGDAADLPQTDVTKCAKVDMQPMSETLRDTVDALSKSGHAAQVEMAVIAAIRRAQETAGKPFLHMANRGPDNATTTNLRAVAARSGKLRAQVARVLKSEETETWERARPTGRLDRFAYARVASGDNSVFAKRTIAGGYQTEIEILCDGSASMRGKAAYATATLALVIAQAAKQVGVKCGITRFTEGTPRAVKRPNESLSQADVQNRFASLATNPAGCTDITGAIVQASAKLAARAPAKRKVLFVVTDGDCAYGPEGVKSANAYARRLDVETAVLCIDTPVHPGFGLAVECDSRDITRAGLNALVKALARE